MVAPRQDDRNYAWKPVPAWIKEARSKMKQLQLDEVRDSTSISHLIPPHIPPRMIHEGILVPNCSKQFQ